ncbi:hypothetical protein F5890DRAFT_636675 [Lentinula detonsa]|uniref:Uncharacterized protein n=1 Tax=Lentinula detonsa TaxID=2804962 RepID=A0AA38PS45_9AGAR|nr:hypothetical protein F5890DRAFT_636675 [Lentinula detonsa]
MRLMITQVLQTIRASPSKQSVCSRGSEWTSETLPRKEKPSKFELHLRSILNIINHTVSLHILTYGLLYSEQLDCYHVDSGTRVCLLYLASRATEGFKAVEQIGFSFTSEVSLLDSRQSAPSFETNHFSGSQSRLVFETSTLTQTVLGQAYQRHMVSITCLFMTSSFSFTSWYLPHYSFFLWQGTQDLAFVVSVRRTHSSPRLLATHRSHGVLFFRP